MTIVDDCMALMESVRQEGMGPARIATALECTKPIPIGDVARFLLSTESLLKKITKEKVPNKRLARDLIWSLESMRRDDHPDGETFSLRFQFCGVSEPSFEAVADRIANVYGELAVLANRPSLEGIS